MKYVALIIGFFLMLSTGGSVHARSPAELQGHLGQARENLRISLATQEWIEAGLEKLRLSEAASPEILSEYEAYLDRVREIVSENRQTARRLTALSARSAGPSRYGEPPEEEGIGGIIGSPIPEEQLTDPLSDLDRELDASLADFDAALLEELELIRTQSAEKMRDLAEEAEAAARRLESMGIDPDGDAGEASAQRGQSDQSGESSQSGQSGESGEDPESGKTAGAHGDGAGRSASSGRDDTEAGAAGPGGAREGADGRNQGRRGRYQGAGDDDIVARQLREAAEKETDPVLKEKLWKEYHAYKKNRK